VELRAVLRLLRERWRLVLAVALTVVAAVGWFTWQATPRYSAQVTLFVSAWGSPDDPASAYQGSLLSAQKVKSYTTLLRGQRVLGEVIDRLGLDVDPGRLAREVSTAAVPDTALLTATVTDPSPRRAQEIANAIGDQFAALVPDLESGSDGTPSPIRVTVVGTADLPTRPVSPRPVRNLAVAVVLGLLAGLGAAAARRSLDTTLRTAGQLAEHARIASLGAVPLDPGATRMEAVRRVRTALRFADVDRITKIVLVTSAVPGEGKTLTACDLAMAMAETEQRVILVDADLRRPGVATRLGLPGGVGLSTVLAGAVSLAAATQPVAGGSFWVLASGPTPPDPTRLLASHRMRGLLDGLRDLYDVVIVDTPPLLPVADAAVTAAACDGVVLVVRRGKTRLEQVREAVDGLRSADIPVLGTVLNFAPRPRPDGYRYPYAQRPLTGSPSR
jgi:receptor protein-tyrosine kinase/non-specific protein-tyrosine kinase